MSFRIIFAGFVVDYFWSRAMMHEGYVPGACLVAWDK